MVTLVKQDLEVESEIDGTLERGLVTLMRGFGSGLGERRFHQNRWPVWGIGYGQSMNDCDGEFRQWKSVSQASGGFT